MKKLVALFFCAVTILCGCADTKLNVEKQSKHLNTYEMELTFNEDKTLLGKQKLEYTNNTDTNLTYLAFHLYPKAFAEGATHKPVSELNKDKAYPNGVDYGDIDILSATVKNEKTDFSFDGADNNILKVGLINELEPKEKTIVELEYKVYVPNINHRFGYGNSAINLANFYPIVAVFENGDFVCDPYSSNGDPFYSECSNYKVNLTANKKYKVASTGVQEKVDEQDETKTYYITAKTVRDFAVVLSDKFEVATETVEDTTINYYYYDDIDYKLNLQVGVDAVKTFNRLFGKYPYKTLSIVKTNFVHGGMEYPNLVYISDETKGADFQNVIVHEVAHQWWYSVVGSNAVKYPWLDEGLTEYSTVLFYEENLDYGINAEEIIKNSNNSYVTFIDLYEEVLGKVDTTMTRSLHEYSTEPEYVYMTYVKGLLLFDNLCKLVGRNKFIECLQNYYLDNAFKNVTPQTFIKNMEKVCNRELESYINTWLNGKVVIVNI